MSDQKPVDPRFNRLFEPVRIGPVTAPNRFYQVPHCSGMGYGLPNTVSQMRATKAEGGWGVVNTEYCSIHPTSDDMPYPHCSLWDEDDVRNMALMTDKVHAHGALAGVELWHGGLRSSNLLTRAAPIGPVSLPSTNDPLQCQAMDKTDIKLFRRWHRDAARRAVRAGFDIVYVYACHTYLLSQFLHPELNTRTDEYGGSAENRFRLVLEIAEETAEEIGQEAAVAVRVAVDDHTGVREERDSLLEALSCYCDLFDATVTSYGQEMGPSRFVKEASLEEKVAHVRELTGKRVVSVGRFTSPETMLSQVRRGVLDFIGAARPSIADPFLPSKIREGRLDEIRECIGCNVCYACDGKAVPIRCTQNPTMGEEWRRGWHPEHVDRAFDSDAETALVVGAGPAGLEASLTLAKRGFSVMLAEAGAELGGRVLSESRLPNLSEWIRVRDYRTQLLTQYVGASVHLHSQMRVEDVLEAECHHVVIATGADWRADGRGRTSSLPIAGLPTIATLTPDDIMAGKRGQGRYVVYDDDCYYMASVIAALLAAEGHEILYVTPDSSFASWSGYTIDQYPAQISVRNMGVKIITEHYLASASEGSVEIKCRYTDREQTELADTLVVVTSREPRDVLWQQLQEHTDKFKSLTRVGDCRAPGIIATAVYDGHRAAREIGCAPQDIIVRRERVVAADTQPGLL